MKKLIFILLILVSATVSAQTTQTKNPEEITLSTTSVTEIILARHKTIPHGNIDVWIIANSSNTGTITVNGLSNDMGSGAATVVSDKYTVITVNQSFFVKASFSTDKFTFGVF